MLVPTHIGETLSEVYRTLPRAIPREDKDLVTTERKAYIAGFLDGDGCIMLQLIRRDDYVLGYQIRASIVFYQKTENKYFLVWLKNKLKNGYIRERNDGISEYTIVGFSPVKKVLTFLRPHLKLKKKQARLALKVIDKTPGQGRNYTPKLLLKLAKEVDKFAQLNYSKKRKRTSVEVEEYLKSHNLLSP